MLAGFVKTKVEPQALEHDRAEKFNVKLFRELGELGLLGITAPEKCAVLRVFSICSPRSSSKCCLVDALTGMVDRRWMHWLP